MRFAHSEWLLCLIALPTLAVIAWLAWMKRGQRWKKLVAPRLQNRLSRGRAPWVHFTSLGLALVGLGGLIIAFSQPESGEEWIEVESEGRNILFCVDISRSMLAEDIQPSRLQASRSAALEILERFPNDRVGVLLFAGENLIQSPLTLDHSFVEQTLAQLDPADIPYGGSNLSGAIDDGVRLLTQTGQQSNIMVVFSDGENSTNGAEASAANAAKEGIFIYALGMGNNEGAFIPDPKQRDGKFRDRSGNPVFSRLNEEALQMLADKTDGFYSRGIGGTFLSKLDSALAEMDRFREEGKHQRVAKPAHQWFLLGGLLLLMLSIFVRTLPLRPAVAVLACLFAFPQEVEASLINDGRAALERDDQLEAHQFFRLAAKEESGERAARLYLASGSAAYRAKSWEAAADCFSEALESDDSAIQQQAHYALATSLFYLGVPLEDEEQTKAWQGAVKHFQASLEISPEDERAARNLRQVQEFLLKKQKKDEQEKEQQKDKQEEKESEEEKEKKEEEEKGEGEEKGDQEGENQEQEKGENDQKDPSPSPNEDPNQDPKQENEPSDEGQEDEPSDKPQESEEKGDETSEQGEEKPSEKSGAAGEPTGENPSGKPEDKPQEIPPSEKGEDPKGETREERARRLLKQYADFGGKAPRRVRRPYNRSAQDW